MPDIGLLQGPPRKPRLVSVQVAPVSQEPVPVSPVSVPSPVAVASEADDIRVAAHAAVVSDDAPLAVLRGAVSEIIVESPAEAPPAVAAEVSESAPYEEAAPHEAAERASLVSSALVQAEPVPI